MWKRAQPTLNPLLNSTHYFSFQSHSMKQWLALRFAVFHNEWARRKGTKWIGIHGVDCSSRQRSLRLITSNKKEKKPANNQQTRSLFKWKTFHLLCGSFVFCWREATQPAQSISISWIKIHSTSIDLTAGRQFKRLL